MIKKDQYVKVVFKNSMQLEGIVESWTDKQSVLKSPDGKSCMIIFNTAEDVMAVKINLNIVDPVKAEAVATELQRQFEEVRTSPSRDDLRLRKLADLRKDLINQEKEIVSAKLKQHTVSEVRQTNYGIPDLSKKLGIK